ncbi:protein YELLOW LEAF 1, choloroplastic isoform X2 [Hevea brasiliensis]|uniref:protein YELLOW LEAF 1, choloroplastic isoform X2 n=1 Tax=Hevea brasiliensis TaxID=3981 RepID=UPI0025FBD8FF|nr:protein YELLOW LEAF 1, choloroplastic isoform X2 [Hevea brasiliensis]
MLAFSASSFGTLPQAAPVKTRSGCKGQKETSYSPISVSTQLQPYDHQSGFNNFALSSIWIGTQLRPIYGRKHGNRKQSASIMCSAALNARCSASGQTQTITREAPTITKAPVREPTKTPKLDDGGPGLPPGGDDGGGDGGGGGGGNWSGGFFLFGFLAFLGFLKDKESEDYRDSRRR